MLRCLFASAVKNLICLTSLPIGVGAGGAGGAIAPPPTFESGGRKYLSAPPGLGSKNPFFNDATGYSPVTCQKNFARAYGARTTYTYFKSKTAKISQFFDFWGC